MTLLILIGLTIAGLAFSLIKSRARTGKALRMSLRMGRGMAGELIALLGLIALVLAYLPQERIAQILGEGKGLLAAVNGALIGSITILPGVIAFPLAKQLNQTGASLPAVAAFITTLTMVGLVTAPIEKRHFGTRYTILRNSISFLFALVIAAIMGGLL